MINMMSSVGDITADYSRAEVLEAMTTNRDAHVSDYGKARELYAKEKLKRARVYLRKLKEDPFAVPRHEFDLVTPVDAKEAYDKIITALAKMQGDSIKLSLDQANCVFNDDWDFARTAKMSISNYSVGAARP